MQEERSFGIVPLQKNNDAWHVLLIQHGAGHWGFPKGHADGDESALMTAERELQEETGMTVVRFLSEKPLQETYRFTRHGTSVKKSVIYFLAEVKGSLKIQLEEIKEAKWMTLKEAETKLTFPSAKSICTQAQEIMKAKKN